MIEKIQNDRINELTEAIVLSYLKSIGQDPKSVVCIDLDGIAKDYYGYDIRYESIAEDDKDKVAFSANGVDLLRVRRNGKLEDVLFPDTTIVLDSYLRQPANSIQRRLFLSHELGHKIYAKISPGHDQGNYYRIFDKERDYCLEELRPQMNIVEAEATQAGCGLLMPNFLLKNTLKRVTRREKFPIFGSHQMLPNDSLKFKKMAEDIGVSPNMLFIQLKKNKLISFKPIEDYLKLIGLKGGGMICL